MNRKKETVQTWKRLNRGMLCWEKYTLTTGDTLESQELFSRCSGLGKLELNCLFFSSTNQSSETFLCCCATWCTTCSVGRACTLLFSSGCQIPEFSNFNLKSISVFQIWKTPVKSPETFHSTPFLDLQPPDIHFTLDLWRTWGRWLKALQVITCTFSPRVVFLAAMWLLYLLSPLDLIPEAVFGIVGCHYSVRLLILVQVGLLDDLVIFILISMYLTFFFRCNPPLLCCNCISLNCRQIMAGMGDNPPAGINQWPFG